jgi:hypothetical protein
MRGSKHWPKPAHTELWSWVEQRLPQMFEQIKPDNIRIWEGMITVGPLKFLKRTLPESVVEPSQQTRPSPSPGFG